MAFEGFEREAPDECRSCEGVDGEALRGFSVFSGCECDQTDEEPTVENTPMDLTNNPGQLTSIGDRLLDAQ